VIRVPPKLMPGDELRIITLSDSLATMDRAAIDATVDTVDKLFGATISFGQRSREQLDHLATSSIVARVEDLEAALRDPKVTAIIAAAGGDNVNQLLPHIDWRLFKKHPKILLGFSDLTVLFNAVYHCSGLITYYGPNAGFGEGKGQRYTADYLRRVLSQTQPVEIEPSKTWYDKDYRVSPPRQRKYSNDGWWSLNVGQASGRLVGGEISSLQLLAGSKYMPKLSGRVLMLEQFMGSLAEFDRLLEALLQLPRRPLAGLLIGRFVKSAVVSRDGLQAVIDSKPQLKRVPVLANIDFGHSQPRLTLPIGGVIEFEAGNNPSLTIKEH